MSKTITIYNDPGITWSSVDGDTRPNADALKKHGYRWDPKQKWWWKQITADVAAKLAAQTTHPFPGCRRSIMRNDAAGSGVSVATIDLRDVSSIARVGNCAACGSYGPLRRTPTGWVCSDCH